jgi:hypothetical protein
MNASGAGLYRAARGGKTQLRSCHRAPTAEHRRLSDSADRRADWKNWGPYLAERGWAFTRMLYKYQTGWTALIAEFIDWNHARSMLRASTGRRPSSRSFPMG